MNTGLGNVVNGLPEYTFTRDFQLYKNEKKCKRSLTYTRRDGIKIYAYSILGITLSSVRLYAMTYCPKLFKEVGISYKHSLMVRAQTPKGEYWECGDFTLSGRSTEKNTDKKYKRAFIFARTTNSTKSALKVIDNMLLTLTDINIHVTGIHKDLPELISEKVVLTHEETIVLLDSMYASGSTVNIRQLADLSADIDIKFF